MTIEPETLMAYADGELGPVEAKRVEAAIARDPSLARTVDRHRRLGAGLRDAFAPVAAAPVPAGVGALLRDSAKVVPMAPPRRPARAMPWPWAAGIAASLCAGWIAGALLTHGGPQGDIALTDAGALRGAVATALGSQLASTQGADAPVRIGVSFRDRQGALCRTFERGSVAGIACAGRGGDWRLARLYGGVARQNTEFRQAGSTASAMMADVEAMAAGAPLDADAERRAVATLDR